MSPRNLIIAGSILLVVIVTMLLLLPDDGPPIGGFGGGDSADPSVIGSAASSNNGSGSSSSQGASSGGSAASDRGGSSTQATDQQSGRTFRNDGSARQGNNGSARGSGASDPDPSNGGFSDSGSVGRDQRNGAGSRPGRGARNGQSGSQAAVPSGMMRITGEVMLEEALTSVVEASGQLQIGTATGSRSITVNSGRFQANVSSEGPLQFHGAVLEGRPARVVSPIGPITPSGPIRVVIRYDALTMLRLKSAITGEDLTQVQVIRVQDYSRSSLPHPGWALPDDPSIVADQSPVALDGRIGSIGAAVALHARAAGHEWRRITVDLVAGGERELTLAPSGSIALSLFGDTEREGVVLRLREQGRVGSPHSEVPITGTTSEQLDGLLPGSWVATLESGHWAHQPEVFDEVSFELIEGDVLELEMEIPFDDEERVDLAGTVFIPEGWMLNFFSVRIRPTGPGSDPINDTIEIHSQTMESTSMAGGFLWEWGPVQVKPGSYGILVIPVGVGNLFIVGDDGLLDANIELPEPVEIAVQAVLADGSGNATPSLIRWAPVRPPGTPGAGAVPVGPGIGGFFQFLVPMGQVMISCSDVAYRPTHQQIQVTSGGPNEFTLPLEPAMGMRLFLEENGTSVPWDLSWHPQVVAQGHSGTVVTRGRTGNGYRILVSASGPYVVSIPDLPGFQPIDPFVITVIDGDVVEAVIEIESE